MVTLRYEIYLMGLIVVFYLSCCQNIVLLLKWSFSCDLTITTSSLFFKLVWTYWVFKFCDHCSWWKGIIVIFKVTWSYKEGIISMFQINLNYSLDMQKSHVILHWWYYYYSWWYSYYSELKWCLLPSLLFNILWP